MNNIYDHVDKWNEALLAKTQTNKDSPDRQLAEIVVGYERMRAWMCIVHEAMKSPNPYGSLVSCSKQFVDEESANKLAVALIALASVEASGKEMTVEVFEDIFKGLV